MRIIKLITLLKYTFNFYETRYMNSFFRLRPSSYYFPIVISQDGTDKSVAEEARNFVKTQNWTFFIQVIH